MKKLFLAVLMTALMAASALAQGKQDDLEKVLNLLDKSSVGFKNLKADFKWDQYQRVVEEHELRSGVMYFKRTGNDVDVSADILSPMVDKKNPKNVTWVPFQKMVLKNGELQILLRKSGGITTYDARKRKDSFEDFLSLGFGGRGHDLPKNFHVKYAGVENAMGEPCYKLELVPKSDAVLRMFPKITLWIDQKSGISVQQKLDQGEGDYRLATYSRIEINTLLPADAFSLKK